MVLMKCQALLFAEKKKSPMVAVTGAYRVKSSFFIAKLTPLCIKQHQQNYATSI